MKNVITIIALAVLAVIVMASHVSARIIEDSPRKGEGFSRMAERLHANFFETIKLNRSRVRSGNLNLIYEDEKFIFKVSDKLARTETKLTEKETTLQDASDGDKREGIKKVALMRSDAALIPIAQTHNYRDEAKILDFSRSILGHVHENPYFVNVKMISAVGTTCLLSLLMVGGGWTYWKKKKPDQDGISKRQAQALAFAAAYNETNDVVGSEKIPCTIVFDIKEKKIGIIKTNDATVTHHSDFSSAAEQLLKAVPDPVLRENVFRAAQNVPDCGYYRPVTTAKLRLMEEFCKVLTV